MELQTLNNQTFDAVISAKGAAMVDFFAPWCAPCRTCLLYTSRTAQQVPIKYLRGLHGKERGAVWCALHNAIFGNFDGVLDGNGRCSCACLGRLLDGRVYNFLRYQWPRTVVDRHKPGLF